LVIKQQISLLVQYRNDLYDGSRKNDELNMAIKMFQDTMMRVYSSIPVVVAPWNDFGGGAK
jgi:hypothetical protein